MVKMKCTLKARFLEDSLRCPISANAGFAVCELQRQWPCSPAPHSTTLAPGLRGRLHPVCSLIRVLPCRFLFFSEYGVHFGYLIINFYTLITFLDHMSAK